LDRGECLLIKFSNPTLVSHPPPPLLELLQQQLVLVVLQVHIILAVPATDIDTKEENSNKTAMVTAVEEVQPTSAQIFSVLADLLPSFNLTWKPHVVRSHYSMKYSTELKKKATMLQ
jgi:hypothetical protein